MRPYRLPSLLALLLALPACFVFARDEDLSGTWAGSFTVASEPFSLAADLRHVNGRLEGPIVGAGMNATLTIFLLDGERVSLTGEYTAQGCSGTLRGDGRLRSDDAMEGTLAVEDTCTGTSSGRFELQRVDSPDGP